MEGTLQGMPPRKPHSPQAPGEGANAPLDLSYEDAVAQVEQIADRIESGEIGLEDSLKQYERGMALIRHCRAILDRAEQRVSELTPDPSGRTGDPSSEGDDAPDAPF